MINILAVDDDPDFHEVLKVKLNQGEYSLSLSFSEKDFFDKFNLKKYDLFLIDLSLDDNPLKGLDLISKIRNDMSSEAPIIVLTGSSSIKNISNAIELGANDFLNKPVDGNLLKEKISSLVAGSKAFSSEILSGVKTDLLPTVQLKTKLNLVSVSEMGFIVEGRAYVAKGTRLKLKSPTINDIFGTTEIEVICNNFTSKANGLYHNILEIDPENKTQLAKLKSWISYKKN